MRERLKAFEQAEQRKREEEEQMKRDLGEKYNELAPMVEALKKSLKRVADNVNRADHLPVKIQHVYTYSKWDQVHEPENVVENVLKDDESTWRALQAEVDLTCSNHQVRPLLLALMQCYIPMPPSDPTAVLACQVSFVAGVELSPGECGPSEIEVYVSNVPDKWTLINTYTCTREEMQVFMLPGEQLCKYVRLRFPANVRGGNIVTIKKVRLKGMVRE